MNLKDVAIAIASMIDYEKLRENIRHLAERLKETKYELTPSKYEDTAWMWLWRKCGGIFHGANTVCTTGCYNTTRSPFQLGRMRKSSSRTGQATVGAEEVEYDEN